MLQDVIVRQTCGCERFSPIHTSPHKLHNDLRIRPKLGKFPSSPSPRKGLLSSDNVVNSVASFTHLNSGDYDRQLREKCRSETDILSGIRMRSPTTPSNSSDLSDYTHPQAHIDRSKMLLEELVLEKEHRKQVIDRGKWSKVKHINHSHVSDNASVASMSSVASTNTHASRCSRSKSVYNGRVDTPSTSVRSLVSSKLYKPKLKASVIYQDAHTNNIPSKFPDYSGMLVQKRAKADLFSRISVEQVVHDRRDFQDGNRRMNRAVNSRGKLNFGMLNIDVVPQPAYDPYAKVKKKKSSKKNIGSMTQYLYSLLHTQLSPGSASDIPSDTGTVHEECD